jgi:lysophospholipase L1-like esterase
MIDCVSGKPLRILVAGGCHVLGYPIGDDHSFPVLLRRKLSSAGVMAEIAILPYVKLSHHGKVAAKCEEFEPDVLILQLGHFEMSRGLEDYLKPFLGIPARQGEPKVRPNFVRNRTRLYLKGLFKRSLDALLRHPLLDLKDIEQSFRSFFDGIRSRRPRLVILLSPLPCPDPLLRYYRQSALPMFQRVANEHGCEFADVLTGAPSIWQQRCGADGYYWDGMHLSSRGHEAVANALWTLIAPTLPSLRKCHILNI